MMKSCFAANALLPSAPGVRNGANCQTRWWKLVKNAYTELAYACEESGDLKIPLERALTQERVHFIEDLIEDTKQGHPA